MALDRIVVGLSRRSRRDLSYTALNDLDFRRIRSFRRQLHARRPHEHQPRCDTPYRRERDRCRVHAGVDHGRDVRRHRRNAHCAARHPTVGGRLCDRTRAQSDRRQPRRRRPVECGPHRRESDEREPDSSVRSEREPHERTDGVHEPDQCESDKCGPEERRYHPGDNHGRDVLHERRQQAGGHQEFSARRAAESVAGIGSLPCSGGLLHRAECEPGGHAVHVARAARRVTQWNKLHRQRSSPA